jgi:hypothetical protein
MESQIFVSDVIEVNTNNDAWNNWWRPTSTIDLQCTFAACELSSNQYSVFELPDQWTKNYRRSNQDTGSFPVDFACRTKLQRKSKLVHHATNITSCHSWHPCSTVTDCIGRWTCVSFYHVSWQAKDIIIVHTADIQSCQLSLSALENISQYTRGCVTVETTQAIVQNETGFEQSSLCSIGHGLEKSRRCRR